MANNTETVAVKTEFVNIVTKGELLLSPISATFSTIVTEASLVEVPPTEGPINKKTITTLYNEVFVDTMSYQAFTENKLRPWENTLEYKHFDTMYTNCYDFSFLTYLMYQTPTSTRTQDDFIRRVIPKTGSLPRRRRK